MVKWSNSGIINTLIDHSQEGFFMANETHLTKRQNVTTTAVKNPNRPEANQFAIYKYSREGEPEIVRNKFNEWSERVLNPGSPNLKASVLTTGQYCHIFSPVCVKNC